MTRGILTVASLLVPALLTAQTDRILVRMSPLPNQTVRQRMTTDVAMTIERDAAPADAPPAAPQQMNMTTTMDVTSTVGAADSRGYYDARVVADNVALTLTFNGQPMPAPEGATAGVTGHPLIFHYDDQGKMLGADPESPGDTATASITQAMTGALTNIAPLTLSVGETVAVPTQVKLPLPGGGPDGAMSLTGEMRFTLTSVTRDGASRIAHLTTASTVSVNRGQADTTQPQGAAGATITGEGRCDVDIDRGIVLHNEQRSTVDSMTGLSPAAAPAVPKTRLRGTVTISADFVK